MANNLLTKKALASGLKELLKTRSLAKIQVKDIVAQCQISRNTFYYHFRDKFELVNWIFYSEIIASEEAFVDPQKISESFAPLCRRMYEDRKFYLACFQYNGQNSLYSYLNRYYYELWMLNIDARCREMGVPVSNTELDLLARMKAHSLSGIIYDWVESGMRDNYMHYFDQVQNILDMDAFWHPAFRQEQKVVTYLQPETKKKQGIKEKSGIKEKLLLIS